PQRDRKFRFSSKQKAYLNEKIEEKQSTYFTKNEIMEATAKTNMTYAQVKKYLANTRAKFRKVQKLKNDIFFS
ncbi:MAG: hypothetical protein MHPSP_002858, partial [Paramarteilia canceri]